MEEDIEGQPWLKYNYIRDLGKGNFGEVTLVQDNITDVQYAKKSIPDTTFTHYPMMKQYYQTQKSIMKVVISPHIVQLVQEWKYQDKERGNKYCQFGNLQDYLFLQYSNNGEINIPHEIIPRMFAQMLLGMNALHRHKIFHRDLKLDNIFVTKDQLLKLGDFGISKMVQTVTQSKLGSRGYQAPQILDKQSILYGSKIDVWSLGIILYQLYHRLKFPSGSIQNLKELQSLKEKLKFLPFENTPQYARDLIRKMLKVTPEQRISWLGIYQHPYIQNLLKQQKDQFEKQINYKLIDAKLFYQTEQSSLINIQKIKNQLQIFYHQFYKEWKKFFEKNNLQKKFSTLERFYKYMLKLKQ